MTLRELAWMRDGKRAEAWEIASHILATLHNVPAGKVICQPWQVNPTSKRVAKPAEPPPIESFASFFLG